MITNLNVSDIMRAANVKSLAARSQSAKKAQQMRLRKHQAIIGSLKIAFYRQAGVRPMASHIASFLRVGFETDPTPPPSKALSIIANYRDQQVAKKHMSDDRTSWPIIDQMLVTEQFDWLSVEMRTFLNQLYSSDIEKLERLFPSGFRSHLEGMSVKQLRALCRQTPGATGTGKKSLIVQQLLIYTPY
jgi:hypothetical protein